MVADRGLKHEILNFKRPSYLTNRPQRGAPSGAWGPPSLAVREGPTVLLLLLLLLLLHGPCRRRLRLLQQKSGIGGPPEDPKGGEASLGGPLGPTLRKPRPPKPRNNPSIPADKP